MTQVRARLPEWPHPDGRFLTELMIATGLRLGDACALGYDPLVFDNDANPASATGTTRCAAKPTSRSARRYWTGSASSTSCVRPTRAPHHHSRRREGPCRSDRVTAELRSVAVYDAGRKVELAAAVGRHHR
jgi:integrase